MLVEFSLKILYPPCVGKIFQFMDFTFLENALFRGISTHVPPHSNSPPSSCHHALGRRKLLILQGTILSRICFPPQQRRIEETMICFIQIKSENMKMTWNISFFIFCMACNFSNVIALQFYKYLWHSMVLILLVLLYNHDKLILKLHQKKWLPWWRVAFYRFGSVQGMINKEVLTQFIYKPS